MPHEKAKIQSDIGQVIGAQFIGDAAQSECRGDAKEGKREDRKKAQLRIQAKELSDLRLRTHRMRLFSSSSGVREPHNGTHLEHQGGSKLSSHQS